MAAYRYLLIPTKIYQYLPRKTYRYGNPPHRCRNIYEGDLLDLLSQITLFPIILLEVFLTKPLRVFPGHTHASEFFQSNLRF